ncbi:haloacid dehalogenase [Mycena metata]|uniref:Haloacid dehalogenase n=1 Tax=Mycena metata TaxID=1033252 RepID=A0AAD7JZZ1_9AGAR|nr:haloacid dehalogenase [Mycena metata]
MSLLPEVKALLFDVFGTVVDSRSSVIRELELLGKLHDFGEFLRAQKSDGNWSEFAATWRSGYLETTSVISAINLPEITPNLGLYVISVATAYPRTTRTQILESISETPQWKAFGEKLTQPARDDLNLVWHRLHGEWSAIGRLAGFHPRSIRLKKEFVITTLSNANVKLVVDMAKHADLPWDTVFCSELFGSFKPDPKVYLTGIRHLSLERHNCVMVAAHIYDLQAAAKVGMRTVYILQADEEFPGRTR